jgi:3-deoxy-D-manno-octulosonic-acid transferase
MLPLYNTALVPLRIAAGLWASIPRRDAAKRLEWAQRLARRLPVSISGGAWIHGASVGEARIVSSLARALRRQRPDLGLAVSAVTPTGRGQLPRPPEVEAAFYAPLDFPGRPRRVLRALEPAVLALVETELWPNLLSDARELGVRGVVINGRLSPRRMRHYRRFSAIYGPLVRALTRIGVQSEDDAERFAQLGAREDRIVVTGNVKYDLPRPAVSADELRGRLGLAPDRPVFVAGSTGRGEERHVLRAYAEARRGEPGLLLILAPRHPERAARVAEQVRAAGLTHVRLSAETGDLSGVDVLVVDTVGELAALYQLAAAAFVGGSLVSVGGHNVLEPAAVGVPVLFGPHTEHVREPAAALLDSGGGLRVAGAEELGGRVRELLADPSLRAGLARGARAVVELHRGALGRSTGLLTAAVDAARPSAGVA